MPQLTVIMPVYNEEEYIAFAIESVLSQRTTFPFVLLIIDDASTDATPDIIERYKKHVAQQQEKTGCIEIISVRQKRNRGKAYCMYTAYNRMLEYQQGGYFIVLDGDDFFTIRDKLERQYNFLEKETAYFGCGHAYISALTNSTIYICADYGSHPMYEKIIAEGIHNITDYPALHYYAHTSAMLYRNIFDAIPPPQVSL